jgi:two-component system chemotaxis sensor kinase CheA
VGLDVVRKNIEEIRGKVEVSSQKGKYTRFVIKLPLTLAIIEGFVTVIGVNKYVFPFNSIDEIIVPQKENITFMDDGGMMLFNRGIYIPIIIAGKAFREVGFAAELEKTLLIVFSYDNKNYGVTVDKIIGKQEIVIKNLGDVLTGLDVFSGGTIFGDGTIGFVVDIEGFLESVKK